MNSSKILTGKTYLITGATRGIGKAIALKLASAGANIVVVGKSVTEDARLGGTIYSAAQEVAAYGVEALPIACDIRNEEQIAAMIQQVSSHFGLLHGLFNNASAISLSNTETTTSKRFDLMEAINVRGTFLVTQYALPLLKKANGSHIITLSPPINLDLKHLAPHVAYTITKYNMSMFSMAWGAEFMPFNIAATALWPATTIATAAVQNLLGGDDIINRSRHPEIVADAAFAIITAPHGQYNSQCVIDEEVLKNHGITQFDNYAVVPQSDLKKDLFL